MRWSMKYLDLVCRTGWPHYMTWFVLRESLCVEVDCLLLCRKQECKQRERQMGAPFVSVWLHQVLLVLFLFEVF